MTVYLFIDSTYVYFVIEEPDCQSPHYHAPSANKRVQLNTLITADRRASPLPFNADACAVREQRCRWLLRGSKTERTASNTAEGHRLGCTVSLVSERRIRTDINAR